MALFFLTLALFGNIFPDMADDAKTTLYSAILRLLRPLVRLTLKHGVPFGVFADMVRWLYVDVADKELVLPGRAQSNSRISVITGLSRKEVLKQKKIEQPVDERSLERYNRAARVISGWVRDTHYTDTNGHPLPLIFETDEGDKASFTELAKQYSGDVPARAILDELIHVGSVSRRPDGKIELVSRAYVPEKDNSSKLSILGTDVRDLLMTISNNIENPENPKFQRKVSYDNVPVKHAAEFKEMSALQCQELLEKLDHWLSKRDRDTNPDVKGSGRKNVGIGIYFFEEDVAIENKQ